MAKQQVSHYATCACLSDKHQFPAFLRTIPSDQHQAAALARMVKYFGWTWIGAVRSDSDYGNNGMASFLKAAQEEGICVEYSESYYRTQPRSKLERVANVIRRSTARVIVAFLATGDMNILLQELARQPPPPLQWIGSENWISHSEFLRFNMCAGAIGFGVPRSVIPGLREYLLDLSPAQALKSPLLTEFWESSFSCSLKGSSEGARECDGSEDIRALQNPYTDTSQLRITNMVYKATYAIAHAIHGVICNDTYCNSTIKFTPWQQAGACIGPGIHWSGQDHLEVLDFADDIPLLAEDEEKLQIVTTDLDSEPNKVALRISSKKQKVMHVNTTGKTRGL
ncbi:hypothetical protein SRHO_G00077950 [Serrasalmus rhombeus]